MSDIDARARVFISYSRRDIDAAQGLVDDLNAAGFEAYLDIHDVAPGEPWKVRLGQLVSGAEKVVFLISPDSVASEVCAWEVDEAERQAKGILPVVLRDTDMAAIPGRLARLNFIFMRTPAERAGTLGDLIDALSTDLQWERKKTEINRLAQDWDAGGRNDRALRFAEEKITGWERWRDRHPATALPPTEVQLSFITQARRVATRRQRRTVIASVTAAVVAIVLSIIAWTQREQAVANEQRAERERNAALTSQSRFLADFAEQELTRGRATKAMLVALEGLPDPISPDRPPVREADIALARAMGQVRLAHVHSGEAAVSPTWVSAVTGIRSEDGAALIDPQTGEQIADLGGIQAAEYSPDGRHLLTRERALDPAAGDAQMAYLRDAATGEVRGRFEGDGYLGFSTGGRYVLHGRHVWELAAAGTPLGAPAYERMQGGFAAFGPEDATIVETGRQDDRAWFQIRRAGDYALIHEGGGNFSFDRAKERVAVQTGDWTVDIWNAATGDTIAALDAATDRRGITGFNSLVFAPGQPVLLIAHMGNPDMLWHYDEGRIEPAPEGYSIYCPPGRDTAPGTFDIHCGIAVSPDGARRAEPEGEAVALRDARNGALLATLEGHVAPVERVVFAPDGGLFLTLTRAETHIPFDVEARLWDARTGDFVATLDHAGMETEAGFSPDGRLVWTGDGDTAKFWRVTPVSIAAALGAKSSSDRLAIDNIGSHAARLGQGGELVLANLADGTRQTCEHHAAVPLHSARFAPDGSHLVVLSEDGSMAAWATDCRRMATADTLGAGPFGLAISGDGTRLVADFEDSLVVLSVPDLQPINTIRRDVPAGGSGSSEASPAKINRTGDRIVARFLLSTSGTGVEETELRVFDAETGDRLGPAHDASDAVFSPDGGKIVLKGKDSGLVDAATGTRITALQARLDPSDQVAFDPTARVLVVLSDAEKTVLILDATTGARVTGPDESWFYPFGFGPIDFSGDGTRFLLLKSGQDTSQNGFDVYETASGKLLHQQVVGDGNTSPGSVLFGPGDRTVIATVGDEILVHDAITYEVVSQMTAPARHVAWAKASADGTRIIAGLRFGSFTTEQIVALPFHESPQTRVAAARGVAARCLTRDERREIFVSDEPPRWCVTGAGLEMEGDSSRWRPLHPYRGENWRSWLKARDARLAPPLPD